MNNEFWPARHIESHSISLLEAFLHEVVSHLVGVVFHLEEHDGKLSLRYGSYGLTCCLVHSAPVFAFTSKTLSGAQETTFRNLFATVMLRSFK